MKFKLFLSAMVFIGAMSLSAQNDNSKTSRQNIKSKSKTEATDNKSEQKFPSENMIKELSLTEKQVKEIDRKSVV